MADSRDSDLIAHLERRNAELEETVDALRRDQADIAQLRDGTERAFMISVTLLAKAAELHDEDAGNHIVRVDRYSAVLARHLGQPPEFCREIAFSAGLHDVGKMSVDAALLKKRGLLTPAERAEMERHTEYGYRILSQSERLEMAAEIAWCHHEKWDGTGYPRRLAGEAIPLSARIVSLADVYDALRSPRPYKMGKSHAEVRDWILQQEGRFDPEVLLVFARRHTELEEIYAGLADNTARAV